MKISRKSLDKTIGTPPFDRARLRVGALGLKRGKPDSKTSKTSEKELKDRMKIADKTCIKALDMGSFPERACF